MAGSIVTASVLIALFSDGSEPREQFSFIDPDACRKAAIVFNETLPQIKAIGKTSREKQTVIDRVLRYGCVDGIVKTVDY